MTQDLEPMSSTARSLLDAAREGLGPDAAAIHRMRENIGATVAAGATGTALAVKLGVLGVVAVVVVGGALIYRGGTRDQFAPRLELPAVRTDAPIVQPAHETTPREVAAPAHIEMSPMPARTASPAPVVESRPPPRADLAREVALVDQAMAALRRGDAPRALAAVRTHAAETAGAGQLAEDAAAIEIEALCRLRDHSSAAKLDAFDARWPQSAQRSRLSEACK